MLDKLPQNQSLLRYNTFQLDVKARFLLESADPDEIIRYGTYAYDNNIPFLILGGGSNVLFTKDFAGLVIINKTRGVKMTDTDNHTVLIEAASGEVWHDLVMQAVDLGLGGIENLSLIPGSVGAAPMQNIGAYGVEIKDVLKSVKFYDFEKKSFFEFSAQECKFGYRESIFKHELKDRVFIISVALSLTRTPRLNTSYGAINDTLKANNIINPGVKDISNAIVAIRQSKLPDPKIIGNAGSFFKNPEVDKTFFEKLRLLFPNMPHFVINEQIVKIPAAWLIEQCGFKGKIYGQTGSHKDQALVIVNYGNATGFEIFEHSNRVIDAVFEKFNLQLTREVNIF